MNEELIRQCAVLAARAWPNATRQFVAEVAIREALDRHVAPLVEAVKKYRTTVNVHAHVFTGSQDVFNEANEALRAALSAFDTGTTPQPSPDVSRLVEAVKAVFRSADRNGQIHFDESGDLAGQLRTALAPFQQEGSQ